ncbi:MAG: hypothetical protein R3F51_13290 [Cyanobacteriota/Melainabacteria group bacterium]
MKAPVSSVGKFPSNREYQTAILDYARQKPGLALSRRELGTLVGMKEIEEKAAEIIESKQAVLLNNLSIAGGESGSSLFESQRILEASGVNLFLRNSACGIGTADGAGGLSTSCQSSG